MDEPASPPTPLQVDLKDATPTAPAAKPRVRLLPPLARVGFWLALLVLVMIGLFLTLILSKIASIEAAESARTTEVYQRLMTAATDSTQFEQLRQLLTDLQTGTTSTRNFWKDLVQLILVNTLLPIITALLGYIFATRGERGQA